MSDVTFGVKVTEEMKSELSELMKMSDMSGKEFMSLLLTTYKIEQAKREDALFESDMSELQILLQRIQNIYLNISEKSKLLLTHSTKQFEEAIDIKLGESNLLKEQVTALEEQLKDKEQENKKSSELIEGLKEENKKILKEFESNKSQTRNYALLHTKFEQEIKQLEAKIEDFKRIELEIEERNKENTALKNRNDELASEVWFLKRETEKIASEKEQLIITSQLELKNSLLEQKLVFNEKIEQLKEENLSIEREFYNKLGDLYENNHNKE